MLTSDFYYDLPQELIAQQPVEPRDSSRLLVAHRTTGDIEHRVFRQITDYLRAGDALVINDTRVIPARLLGHKADSGGAVELLLLKRLDNDTWEALVRPGRKARLGTEVVFGDGRLRANLLRDTEAGGRVVRFRYEGVFEEALEELGRMPLPPYIHKELEDRERYQTVYAAHDGSAAAPTAGLHFTPELLKRVAALGVDIVPVLLHVGLGTFRPVKAREVSAHTMHSERYEVTPDASARINAARARGGRVVCVGTTTVRTLESVANAAGVVRPGCGETAIFITPGVPIRAVDALITNFHLPESTLLMLVSALMGREQALAAYAEAVRERYRFFSFGDAMLIL